ncbi:hypothetical protein BDR26DRAFT_939077 [Obelidium mucronatum]|nr:hypothetical protein BDR26DRAFT_939077 [Obelidium mucronatum]
MAPIATTTNKSLVEVADQISSLDELVKQVGDDSCGAIATFSGTTRNSFEGKEVTQLAYEAYVPMAIKQIHIASCNSKGKVAAACPRSCSSQAGHCSVWRFLSHNCRIFST